MFWLRSLIKYTLAMSIRQVMKCLATLRIELRVKKLRVCCNDYEITPLHTYTMKISHFWHHYFHTSAKRDHIFNNYHLEHQTTWLWLDMLYFTLWDKNLSWQDWQVETLGCVDPSLVSFTSPMSSLYLSSPKKAQLCRLFQRQTYQDHNLQLPPSVNPHSFTEQVPAVTKSDTAIMQPK